MQLNEHQSLREASSAGCGYRSSGLIFVKTYTTEEIRAIEAAEFARRDSFSVMQLAGEGVARQAQAMLPNQQGQLLVIAGAGNNGGDALVAATWLHRAGYNNLTVFLLGQPASKDAQKALQNWQEVGGEVSDNLNAFQLQPGDLVIDGLFGIGLNRDVTGAARDWIEAINTKKIPVLAIDVPSGLNADTGQIMGIAVKANTTISFFGAKTGFYKDAGSKTCGEIIVDELGRKV